MTLCAAALYGQTQIDAPTQIKGASKAPVRTGTTLPVTCVVGELFYDTDAPAGQNLHGCTGTNVFSLLGGTGIVMQKAGSGNPNGSQTCTAPSVSVRTVYFDTSTQSTWQCIATNTWKLVLDTTGTGPATLRGAYNTTDLTAPATSGEAVFQFGDHGLEYFPNGGALSRTVVPKDCHALVTGDFIRAVATDGTVTCGTPAGGGGGGYALMFGAPSAFSPSDATVYYLGLGGGAALGTQQGRSRVIVPVSGTITACYFWTDNQGLNGSAETSTVALRLNGATDTVISTAVHNDSDQLTFGNTGLSIGVSAGDWIVLKWTTPTWATNPQDVNLGGTCYVAQ